MSTEFEKVNRLEKVKAMKLFHFNNPKDTKLVYYPGGDLVLLNRLRKSIKGRWIEIDRTGRWYEPEDFRMFQ